MDKFDTARAKVIIATETDKLNITFLRAYRKELEYILSWIRAYPVWSLSAQERKLVEDIYAKCDELDAAIKAKGTSR